MPQSRKHYRINQKQLRQKRKAQAQKKKRN